MAQELPPIPSWLTDYYSPPGPRPKGPIADPPGFNSGNKRGGARNAVAKQPTVDETDTLKIKKAWEVAFAPAKSLPMNAVMMYMSGNTLQIFSIMMVWMLFKTPIQSLLQTTQIFARFETDGNRAKLVLVKLTYIVMNLLALSLGLWKINSMGLFPYVWFIAIYDALQD